MAVALNADGTQATATASTTVSYTGLTVAAGSNTGLTFIATWLGNPGAITVARWDDGASNQNLTTLLGPVASVNGQYIAIFGLVNPIAGNKTLKLTWTNSTEYGVEATAWNNVDQSGGATSFPNAASATGNTNAPTITITLPTNGAGVSALATGSVAGINSVSATQILIAHGAGAYEGGGSRSTSSGTFSGVLGGTDQWVIGAVGIAEFTVGGASPVPILDTQYRRRQAA